jgi:hypothetical protein
VSPDSSPRFAPLTNFDGAGTTVASGKDLMEQGLIIETKDKPGAAVIVYRQVAQREAE